MRNSLPRLRRKPDIHSGPSIVNREADPGQIGSQHGANAKRHAAG